MAATTDGEPGDGPGGGGDGANGGAWRNQPRDAEGRWTDMGGGASAAGANSTQLAQNPNEVAVVSSDQPSPSFCKLQKIRCLAEASDVILPLPRRNAGFDFFNYVNACMGPVGCLGIA